MKQITTLLFALLITGMVGGQTCYTTNAPYKTANASGVSQQFVSCSSGDQLEITTNFAVFPFVNDAIVFNVYDSQNNIIGSTIYNGDVMVYTYESPQDLPQVTVFVNCPILVGYSYRWSIEQCCQVDGGNGLPMYIIIQQTHADQIQGSTTYEFTNSQGVEQNSFTIQYDIRASVRVNRHDPPCVGDFNNDGVVDNLDAIIIASQYGKGCEYITADLDGDCDVDDNDLFLFKPLQGTNCN